MLLSVSATLGGAILGFLAATSLYFRRMSLDEMGGMGIFLPVLLILVGAIGAAVGALVGLTVSLAGAAWGVQGVCGGALVWGIGFAVWYGVYWFRRHGQRRY